MTHARPASLPASLQIVGASSYGGGGYLLVAWCRWLKARGARVEALATDPVIVERLRALDVPVMTDIDIPRDIAPVADARALARLVPRLRTGRYDVVHTYTATPGVVGRVAARLAGVPIILHHQAAWTVDERTSLTRRMAYRAIEQVAARAGTSAICVSDAVRDAGLAFGLAPASRLAIVHNGIEVAPFTDVRAPASRTAAREAYGIPEDAFVIGVTARLSADKNVAALFDVLDAVARALAQEGSAPRTVRVLVAGDGPEQPALAARVARDGLPVSLCGFQADVRPVLAACDVWLTTTRREGLSISLLEAMASGCPVVASAIPPNVEVVRDGVDGVLVPLDAPEALRDVLLRLACDPAQASRLGASAAARVRTTYALDRMFEETWALYQPVGAMIRGGSDPTALANSR